MTSSARRRGVFVWVTVFENRENKWKIELASCPRRVGAMWAHLRARAMGAAGSTPESLEGSDVATERVSAPSTTSAPRGASTSGRGRWGWDEVIGKLAEKEVITLRNVDAMQSMWQRALQAKTAALQRLELELEQRDLRIHELELERAAREEGDAFAAGDDDASHLAAEADASRALALRSASAVIDDMRRDMEDRECRLTALTEAIHRSSERSVENELVVAAARDELVAREERHRASETRLARQLEESRAVEEELREELRAGERAFGLLQAQFAAVMARARESRARVADASASRLSRRAETLKTSERTLDEASREMRTVTDASKALETLRDACDGIAAKRALKTKSARGRRGDAAGLRARPAGDENVAENESEAVDDGDDDGDGDGDGELVRAVTAALEAAAAEREALTRERDELRARLETETASLRAEVEALRRANAVRVEDHIRRGARSTLESEEGPSSRENESEPTKPTEKPSNDGSIPEGAARAAASVVVQGDVSTGKAAQREEDPEFREMRRHLDGLRAALASREET